MEMRFFLSIFAQWTEWRFFFPGDLLFFRRVILFFHISPPRDVTRLSNDDALDFFFFGKSRIEEMYLMRLLALSLLGV